MAVCLCLRLPICLPVCLSPCLTLAVTVFRQSSREQLAIAEFAHSLLVIPKTLSNNAAQDSTELVAKMRGTYPPPSPRNAAGCSPDR